MDDYLKSIFENIEYSIDRNSDLEYIFLKITRLGIYDVNIDVSINKQLPFSTQCKVAEMLINREWLNLILKKKIKEE